MKFPSNTDWKLSAKGNYWRSFDGITLVVGGSDKKGYWVRVGDDFLPYKECSLEKAKQAAEEGVGYANG